MRVPSGDHAALLTVPPCSCRSEAEFRSPPPTPARSDRRLPKRCGCRRETTRHPRQCLHALCRSEAEFPLSASHTCTVRSSLAEAMYVSSGDHATLLTLPACPVVGQKPIPALCFPHLYGPIKASRSDVGAVVRPRHAPYSACMPCCRSEGATHSPPPTPVRSDHR